MKTAKECISCKYYSEALTDYPCPGCPNPEFIAGSSITITTYNNSKPERDNSNKMKSTTPNRIIEVLKEIFTLSDNDKVYIARVAGIVSFIGVSYVLISHSIYFMLIMLLIFWLLGYFSRKPDPNRKGFKKWLKICKLKIQIGILKKNLKPFTDLRKYKHKSEAHIREMVLEWREKLKELKRQLKEL